MSKKLKEKFDIILARERRMAKSVAMQTIKPKPLSVWEVLIPIIFIFGYMKSKGIYAAVYLDYVYSQLLTNEFILVDARPK